MRRRRSASCATKFRKCAQRALTSYLLDVIAELRGASQTAPVRAWDVSIRAAVDPAFDIRVREAPGSVYAPAPAHAHAHAQDTKPAVHDEIHTASALQMPAEPDPDTSTHAGGASDAGETSVITHDADDSRIPIAGVLNDPGDSSKRPWEGAVPDAVSQDSPLKRQRTT